MRGTECIVLANDAAAGTYTMPTGAGKSQGLQGGLYLVMLKCTGTPALQLYQFDQEGNAIPIGAAFTTTGGGSYTVYLGPGQIEAIVGTSSANYLQLVRVPLE